MLNGQQLQRAWLRRGALAWLLRPIAVLHGAITSVRRLLFRIGLLKVTSIGVPVIVVGNVIAGGSGKTPVVMAIVRHLQSRGLCVGVVSRGYGRETTDCREVLVNADPSEVGDEPALIRHATGAPVFVAGRRVEAAQALLARHPNTQVIVSDDGLQHLALGRDIEICVFDDRGVGNGWLLPAGPLRETWPRRCDLVLHTGTRPAFAGFTAVRSLADDVVHSDGKRTALGDLVATSQEKVEKFDAVAAIARPDAFFDMLEARGVHIDHRIALPDHHDFGDWVWPQPHGTHLLCTEKDALKLWRSTPEAIAVPLVFTPEPAFFAALDAKLSSADGYQAA
ncbi:tetraacyldisaccharide 4'-kinase [soil metagenome]